MFDGDDGHLYSTDVSLGNHMTAEGGLPNGGTVILEYVEDGTRQLTSLDSYKL